MVLDVRPLTPDRFADLAALFEEGGDPKWCWCVYFRFRGRDWSNSTAAENRAALEDLAERPLAPGLVGYRDGRAVGWVSLAPREDYERLSSSKILAPVDDTPVWSIVCFVVSRKIARSGRCRRHACGGDRLRASPRRDDARGVSGRCRRPGACPRPNAFHGTLAMFERAGFKVVERRQWNATTPVRPIVRLALEPARRSAPEVQHDAGSTLLRHPSRPWHRRPSGLTRLSPRR